MAKDLLSEYQENELKRLARFSLSPLQLTLVLGLAIGLAMMIVGALVSAPNDELINDDQRRELSRSGAAWAITLATDQQSQADWLDRRGISLERNLYSRLSFRVLDSALTISEYQRRSENYGFFLNFLVILIGAALRLGFLVIASARLILACVIWAWWSSRRKALSYVAADPLGQTGNGRLFFSGISVNLNERDSDGSPAKQVAGLACPRRAPASLVNSSAIAKILTAYGAANPVNLALASVILNYRQQPDHVAFAEEQTRLDHAYETGTLGAYVEALLPEVLKAHRAIITEERGHDASARDLAEQITAHEETSQTKYSKSVGEIMRHLLSPRIRASMSAVSPAEVATICLALEAGKIMLFAVEGGKWNRRSHFPELSARAMLHSCPEFSDSYSSVIRARLRRALVFSGEPSVFAPIRLPQDLSMETRGLLGFARILLSPPHQLPSRAASEELAGILAHIHIGFEKLFFASASELDPDLLDEAYTSNNVLLLKLPKVMTLLRQVIDSELLRRLHELVAIVDTFKIEKEQIDTVSDEPKSGSGSHDTPLPTLSDDEISALTLQFKFPENEIRDWGVLRLALYQFGWLGRRVSERTVPNSSIVFAAIKADPRADTLTGLEGVVPLRATRCREHWGKQWAARFIQVDWARIADSRRDFERLLAGEITDAIPGDDDDDGESIVGAAS